MSITAQSARGVGLLDQLDGLVGERASQPEQLTGDRRVDGDVVAQAAQRVMVPSTLAYLVVDLDNLRAAPVHRPPARRGCLPTWRVVMVVPITAFW